jgi:potassium channel subfamily K
MNDPGLHESTQEAAQDVEKNSENELAEQEEQEFLDPRYFSRGKGMFAVG